MRGFRLIAKDMGIIFDGKSFAAGLEVELVKKALDFEKRYGRKAKLVVFLHPDNLPGALYVKTKKRMALKLGVEMEIFELFDGVEVAMKIEDANNDKNVDGVIVQLPFVGSDKLVELIRPEKDVDGLRVDSLFESATVASVMLILREAQIKLSDQVVVVGARGEVGVRLVRRLKKDGVRVVGMDKDDFDQSKLSDADVIVSSTGSPEWIKPEMVKGGVVAVDVGYPGGDFDPAVAPKAKFFTPVPGGVGPVTVVSLFANLLREVKKEDNLKR